MFSFLPDFIGQFFDSIWSFVGLGVLAFAAMWSFIAPLFVTIVARVPLLNLVNAWVIKIFHNTVEKKLLIGSTEEQRLASLSVPSSQRGFVDWGSTLTYRQRLYSISLEEMKTPFHGEYALNYRSASHLRPEFSDHLRIAKGDLAMFSGMTDGYMRVLSHFKREKERDQHTFTPNMHVINRCDGYIDDCQFQLRELFWRRMRVFSWATSRKAYLRTKQLKRRLNILIRGIRERRKRYRIRERQIFRKYERDLRRLAFQISQVDEQRLRQPIHELRADFGVMHAMVTSGSVVNTMADPEDPEAVSLRDFFMLPEDFPLEIEAAKAYMLKQLDGRAALSPTPAREDILECYLRKHLLEDIQHKDFSIHYLHGLPLPGALGLSQKIYHHKVGTTGSWLQSKPAKPKPRASRASKTAAVS